MNPSAGSQDLHQIEAALEASETRFRELAENTRDVYFSRDATTGSLLYVSPAYESVYGRSPESLYADAANELDPVHPEDRAALQAATEANRGGLTTELEYRLLMPDGEVRWILYNAQPVTGSEGRFERVVGTARDITARKRADAELARSRRALKMLSQSNRALTRIEDETALLAEICRLAVDLGGYRMAWVGYARDDAARTIEPMAHAGHDAGYLSALRLSWADEPAGSRGPAGDAIRRREIIQWDDMEACAADMPFAPAAKLRGYRSVISLPLCHGEQIFGMLALYSGELQAASMHEIGLLSELADNLAFGIDNLRSRLARNRIEAAVFKVAAGVSGHGEVDFFEHLAGNMAQAVGAQGAFVTRLLPGEPLIGRCLAGEVDGQKIASFDYRIDEAPCRALLQAPHFILPRGVSGLYPQATFLQTIGVDAYIGHRLEDAAGQLVGMLVVVFREPLQRTVLMVSALQIFAARASAEIERMQADQEIRRLNACLEERVQERTAQLKLANQELESFCYSVSHDLRTPLSAVDGFASLLELSLDDLPESLAGKSPLYLKRIRTGVVQMGDLIDALLSLARLAREPLHQEPVDLSQIANELLATYREREPTRVLEVQVQPAVTATGDPRLLRQVLDNLLGNAWKFSAGMSVGQIAFGTETGADGQPVYFVRDNGAGFDMAYSQKLFGPFQRLHSPSEFEGTGIGLATVQRIVLRHGGRVWGESAPGQGATFRFSLGGSGHAQPGA